MTENNEPQNTLEPEEEDPSEYQGGRYHPVQLGDVLNQRYQIVKKLGYGVYGTVWLAKDPLSTTLVAVKVCARLVPGNPRGKPEFTELRFTEVAGSKTTKGSAHVVKLLDHFRLDGPNGNHLCLVFDYLGPGFGEVQRYVREKTGNAAIPAGIVKRLVYQVLLALKHLHDLGIIHTDIKASNLLFKPKAGTLPKYDSYPNPLPALFVDQVATVYQPLPSQPLPFVPLEDFDIVLIDLGSAEYADRPFGVYPLQPTCLRAPEVLIRAPVTTAIDVWNLGCLTYEFYSGYKLFDPQSGPTYTDVQYHLAIMECLLGQFPTVLLEKGAITDELFSEDGTVRNVGMAPIAMEDAASEWIFAHGADQRELELFSSFMWDILTLDPSERPTAACLLEHPWLDSARPQL